MVRRKKNVEIFNNDSMAKVMMISGITVIRLLAYLILILFQSNMYLTLSHFDLKQIRRSGLRFHLSTLKIL